MTSAAILEAGAEANSAHIVTDLLRSTLRAQITLTVGAYQVWYYWYALTWPEQNSGTLLLVGVLLVLGGVAAARLLNRAPFGSLALWIALLEITLLGCLWATQEPELMLILAALPMMATIIGGWPVGTITLGLGLSSLYGLSVTTLIPTVPAGYASAIIIGGAFGVVLAWTVTRDVVSATSWSTVSWLELRQTTDELRDRRMELLELHEDLAQANAGLARLSDRLRGMYQIAQEARKAKEEFVANVSHELRTPLNMIIGFSDMITESPEAYGDSLPTALMADIAAIQRNSRHLARLVDDVLDLSQVEAGRMALTRAYASVPQLMEEAVEAVRALFESKGVELRVDCPKEVPSLFCDAVRIRQVIINLLSNAGRFTKHGAVAVNVRHTDQAFVFRVADTGPGIALDDQERIFQPFEQLDASASERHGGSGLGLSICRRFVEMHEGQMWVESPSNPSPRNGEGPGATFAFSIPVDVRPPVALASGTDARRWFSPYDDMKYRMRTRRSRAPTPERAPRYVVLEEGHTLQRILARYASDAEIVGVHSTDDALAELEPSPARALIVNASPRDDGSGFGGALANLPFGTPVVRCWVPGYAAAAERLGVLHYLVKPVSRESLLKAIDSARGDAKSVLLVDDQPEALQLFVRMLASSGREYQILRAGSGTRAMDIMRQRQPDVVLLDLVMPGMDGFQVLRQASRDPVLSEIPIVIVTSRDPSGAPVASESLNVARSGGLSVADLVSCIEAVSEVLSPSAQPAGRGRPAATGA